MATGWEEHFEELDYERMQEEMAREREEEQALAAWEQNDKYFGDPGLSIPEKLWLGVVTGWALVRVIAEVLGR